MPSVQQRYAPGEIARLGRAIYEARLRDELDTEDNVGKFLIINVETGEYEMGNDPDGDDDMDVEDRAAARFPDAGRFGMRIGYPAVAAIGTTLRSYREIADEALKGKPQGR